MVRPALLVGRSINREHGVNEIAGGCCLEMYPRQTPVPLPVREQFGCIGTVGNIGCGFFLVFSILLAFPLME